MFWGNAFQTMSNSDHWFFHLHMEGCVVLPQQITVTPFKRATQTFPGS